MPTFLNENGDVVVHVPTSLARDDRLRGGKFIRIYMAIAMLADDDGVLRVSQSKVAEQSASSRQTVNKTIQRFRVLGYMQGDQLTSWVDSKGNECSIDATQEENCHV